MSQTDSQKTTQEEVVPPVKRPKKRWKKWLLRTVVLVILLMTSLSIFSIWLVRTHSGLNFAATKMPTWFGVKVEVQNLEGTIWDGFKGDEWEINAPAANISLSSFSLVWQSQKLWQRQLWIDQIALGSLRVVTKPTQGKPSAPAKLPESIDLPVEVYLGQLSLDSFALGGKSDPFLLESAVHYTYQHQKHQLTIDKLLLPWGEGQGEIVLKGGAPFALTGQVDLEGVLDGIEVAGHVKFSGSLNKPKITGELIGNEVAANVLAELQPFADSTFKKIERLELAAGNINPNAFWDGAPKGNISTSLFARPEGEQLHVQLVYADILATSFKNGGIPIKLVSGSMDLNVNNVLNIHDLTIHDIKDGTGKLAGNMDLSKQTMNLAFMLQNISLQDTLSIPVASALNGRVLAKGEMTAPVVNWDLNTEILQSQGQLTVVESQKNRELHIANAFLSAKQGGKVNLSGSVGLAEVKTLNLTASMRQFNPKMVLSLLPVGNITANLAINGQLAPDLQLKTALKFDPSTLSGESLKGYANLNIRKDYLEQVNIAIRLGSNQIETSGALGRDHDVLRLNIAMPNLAHFGFGLSGAANINGTVQGKFQKLLLNLTGSARNLQMGKVFKLGEAQLVAKMSPDMSAPLNVMLDGKGLVLEDNLINHVNLSVSGTGKGHKLSAKADVNLDKKDYLLNLGAQGGVNQANVWQGQLQTLDLRGATNLLLQHPTSLEIGTDHFKVGNARWGAFGGSLNLERLSWQAGQNLSTKGSVNNIEVAQILNLFLIKNLESSIVLKGDWDLNYGNSASGFIKLYRQSGDIAFVQKAHKNWFKLEQLELVSHLQGSRINVNVEAQTDFAKTSGKIALLRRGSGLGDAALDGLVMANLPNLSQLRRYLPVYLQVKGQVLTNIRLSGTLTNPLFSGTIDGKDLWIKDHKSGLRFGDGVLNARFDSKKLILEQLKFISTSTRKRSDSQEQTVRKGEVRAQGLIQMVSGLPDINLDIVLERFSAFDRPNRVLVLSGKNNIRFNPKIGVNLVGDIKVDFGRIDLPDIGTPQLDTDVVVKGREVDDTENDVPINMNLNVNLGNRLKFSGQGLNTNLEGELHLVSKAKEPIRANGQINLVKGRFKAYGQDLDIEKGVISFVGPLDNPALNFRAVRRMSPVGAGVEVSGGLQNPRLNLVANEPMSQKDKLAWLILGRAAGGEEDDSALAASAGAWLAGSINDRVGVLDDLGIVSRKQRMRSDGSVEPAEQFITMGKHITKEIYVGYEYGLNSAEQAVKLAYQFSQAWQFILRIGQISSEVEAQYSIRFD